MRVFVDVGAHYGETLDVALDPAWGFDRIFALEPSLACQPVLGRFRDNRLIVQQRGLGRQTSKATLYGAGLLGASLHQSKRQKVNASALPTEQVQIVRASRWLSQNVPAGAEVYMKFNCEGAECDILDDLLDAGLADRLTSLYIDFDIRKVEGQSHRQAETERRLKLAKVRYLTSESLGCAANSAVSKWLSADCPRKQPQLIEELRFRLRLYAPAYVRVKMLAKLLLPKKVFSWVGHRFGRISRAA